MTKVTCKKKRKWFFVFFRKQIDNAILLSTSVLLLTNFKYDSIRRPVIIITFFWSCSWDWCPRYENITWKKSRTVKKKSSICPISTSSSFSTICLGTQKFSLYTYPVPRSKKLWLTRSGPSAGMGAKCYASRINYTKRTQDNSLSLLANFITDIFVLLFRTSVKNLQLVRCG